MLKKNKKKKMEKKKNQKNYRLLFISSRHIMTKVMFVHYLFASKPIFVQIFQLFYSGYYALNQTLEIVFLK